MWDTLYTILVCYKKLHIIPFIFCIFFFSKTSIKKVKGGVHLSVNTLYRVSHFGCNCWISRLLVNMELCGFREPELLFCERKDSANKIVIILLVSELQGDIENVAFSGTPYISVVWQLVEKVKTNSFRTFYIVSSGVVKVF